MRVDNNKMHLWNMYKAINFQVVREVVNSWEVKYLTE
jgi:hypothetical protein